MITVNALQVVKCDTADEFQRALTEAQAAAALQPALKVSSDVEGRTVTVMATGMRLDMDRGAA